MPAPDAGIGEHVPQGKDRGKSPQAEPKDRVLACQHPRAPPQHVPAARIRSNRRKLQKPMGNIRHGNSEDHHHHDEPKDQLPLTHDPGNDDCRCHTHPVEAVEGEDDPSRNREARCDPGDP